MSESQLREVEVPPPGRPRWMVGAIAAAVVLLVVAVLVTRDGGASATSGPLAIAYTGQACEYGGPTEFAMADDIVFSFTNESDALGGGATLYPVEPGTALPSDGDEPMWSRFEFHGLELDPGESGEFTMLPSEPGPWVLICGIDDDNATPETPAIDRYATMINITP